MTTDSAPRIKITYATLSADNEELHTQFEAGLAATRASLGGHHQQLRRRRVARGRRHVRGPHRRSTATSSSARSRAARVADVDDAVAAARAAQPAWAAVPWRERVAIIRRAGDLISERLMEYAPIMAIEVGKNRIEALGEVEESADLLRYYAQTMDDNDGYDHPMGNLGDAAVHTRSVLRPHGVFAVISPFNFPMALACGPAGAALLAATRSSSSRRRRRRCRRSSSSRPTSRPASRRAPSTSSWARARRSARRSRTTRASTASCSPARTRSG